MNLEQYLLVSLAEECAEVAQRATKALRFGLGERQPGQSMTNAVRLVDELDDLCILVDMLRAHGYIPTPPESTRLLALPSVKRAKIYRYMDLAEEHPNVHLTTSWQPAEVISEAIRRIGAEKVFFGSDWPFVGHNMEVGIDRIRDCVAMGVLTTDESELVLGGNAARLLGIPACL